MTQTADDSCRRNRFITNTGDSSVTTATALGFLTAGACRPRRSNKQDLPAYGRPLDTVASRSPLRCRCLAVHAVTWRGTDDCRVRRGRFEHRILSLTVPRRGYATGRDDCLNSREGQHRCVGRVGSHSCTMTPSSSSCTQPSSVSQSSQTNARSFTDTPERNHSPPGRK